MLRRVQNLSAADAPKVLTDSILLAVAGLLLLTPGFLTDAIGLLLLIPPVRRVIAGHVARRAAAHIKIHTAGSREQDPPRSEPEPAPSAGADASPFPKTRRESPWRAGADDAEILSDRPKPPPDAG